VSGQQDARTEIDDRKYEYEEKSKRAACKHDRSKVDINSDCKKFVRIAKGYA
jgi:hypothetical protein